jgi:dihydrofolate reductase
MRRVRYQVAASLDGFIAGPNGEFDWITSDPEIDFGEIYSQFDTAVMGRKTFEVVLDSGRGLMPGMKTFVCSRTLRQSDHPDVTVVAENSEEIVRGLREQSGKDIWLFGGGSLFRSLAAANLVDSVEIALIPVLLGAGIPLLPPVATPIKLALKAQRVYSKTGIVLLEYEVS